MLRALAVIAILAFAAALAQAVFGIGLWKTVPLEAADIRPDQGHAAHAKLPEGFDRPLDDARGYVTENGVPTLAKEKGKPNEEDISAAVHRRKNYRKTLFTNTQTKAPPGVPVREALPM